MDEIRSRSVLAQAVQEIRNAVAIQEGKGEQVLGWEIFSTFGATVNELQCAIWRLEDIEGSEARSYLAQALELFGDLMVSGSYAIAYRAIGMENYEKAISILEGLGDTEGVVRVRKKCS